MANYSIGSNNSCCFLFKGVLYVKAWQDRMPSNQFDPFNRCVKEWKFHMGSGRFGNDLLKPGMWNATVDLSDAYYHIGNVLDNIYYIR